MSGLYYRFLTLGPGQRLEAVVTSEHRTDPNGVVFLTIPGTYKSVTVIGPIEELTAAFEDAAIALRSQHTGRAAWLNALESRRLGGLPEDATF